MTKSVIGLKHLLEIFFMARIFYTQYLEYIYNVCHSLLKVFHLSEQQLQLSAHLLTSLND